MVFEVTEDLFADRGKPLEVEANMYDHTVIKGLNVARKENGTEDDYFINNDIDDLGFISYIPKYITDPDNFADPKLNKVLHNDAHRVIFRAYVIFKTGYKIYLKDKKGIEQFDYPHDYTWQHVGVFETLMEPPPKFTKWSQSESYTEWISKHHFGTWRMVDLDNWMVGNPLVIPKFEPVKHTAGNVPQPEDIVNQ